MAVIDERISTKKNGFTKYRVRIRKLGKLLTATFKTRDEAQRYADTMEEQVDQEPRGSRNRHTMFDLLDRYERDILIHKKHTTARNQRHQILYWKSQIGHYSISDVTPSVIVDYRNKLVKGRSPATVVRYLALLSHTFTIAIKEYEWCDTNPVMKIMKPREPKGRTRYLNEDERDRLLTACKESSNPYLYAAVVLSLATGCRKNELMTLTWDDVDLGRAIMTFRDTKNKEMRSLPLVGHSLDLMRELKKRPIRYEWTVRTNYVFPSHNGKMPLDIRHAWYKALKKANIRSFRWHDLRRSCGSYLAMNGANAFEIMECLGHKTLAMAQRYVQISQTHNRSIMERMNNNIFGC